MNRDRASASTTDDDVSTGTLMHRSLEMQAAARGAVTVYIIRIALRGAVAAAGGVRRVVRGLYRGAISVPRRCGR